jgi:hypothetical protein
VIYAKISYELILPKKFTESIISLLIYKQNYNCIDINIIMCSNFKKVHTYLQQWHKSQVVIWYFKVGFKFIQRTAQMCTHKIAEIPCEALYEVYLARMNQQVGAVRTHRNADCLLKNTFTKHVCYQSKTLTLTYIYYHDKAFWFTCSHRLINYLTFQIFDYDLL